MGRARSSAGCAGAHLGLTRGTSRARRGARADLGIASATGRRPSTFRARPELGRSGACRSTTGSPFSHSGVRGGRGSRTRTVMGCAAGRCACASRAGVSALGTCTARTSSRPANRGAVVERISGSGSSRAIVGSARRLVSVAHPDSAIVEPSGSGVERARAARIDAGSTRLH